MLPSEMLKGLRVLRSGLWIGDMKTRRFEPSQAWAMTLKPEDTACFLNMDPEDPNVIRYLKGETLSLSGFGWKLLGVSGCPLGWAKGAGSFLKNKYHRGWRWTGKEISHV